jgi:hypothetical protein
MANNQPVAVKGSGLEKFLNQVKAFLEDATTLDVITVTGNVEVLKSPGMIKDKAQKTTDATARKEIDWTELIKQALETGQTTAALKVVAATHIELDGDSLLFVSNEDDTIPLRQTHIDATVAAQKYREGIICALAEIAGVS